MALRKIVTEEDSLLRNKSREVTEINDRIITLLDDMIETDASCGVLTINQEREYKCRFEMCDIYGNKSRVDFVIKGKRGDIPEKTFAGTPFHYDGYNTYNMNGLYVHFPVGTFYDDIDFTAKATSDSRYYSAVHLGQALVNYTNFEKRGFHVVALFDVDENIIGK